MPLQVLVSSIEGLSNLSSGNLAPIQPIIGLPMVDERPIFQVQSFLPLFDKSLLISIYSYIHNLHCYAIPQCLIWNFQCLIWNSSINLCLSTYILQLMVIFFMVISSPFIIFQFCFHVQRLHQFYEILRSMENGLIDHFGTKVGFQINYLTLKTYLYLYLYC